MEAQENSQTERNVQTPKKRELALVSRSTYIKEKALQWIFFACVLGGRYRHPDFCLYHVLGAARLYRYWFGRLF